MRLDNKVAIITGGSRGIGYATAIAFAREGARLVIVGRDKHHCDDAAAFISKNGGSAISIPADVSREADVARVIEQTREKMQRIDILVNCAAVNLPYRAVTDLTLDAWNKVIGTNLTGTFLCCRAVLPQMISQQSGKIINFSSMGGRMGAPGRAPYRSSKAALINFTECLAAEVKGFGIDVNAICPGVVETDMLREITGGHLPKVMMPAEDIAAVALFLATSESRALTGTAINAFGPGDLLLNVSSTTRPTK